MEQNAVKLTKNQDYSHDTERGSIIVWIMVAIALFAALSYTVSQNSRSGANSVTTEQANLAAIEILDYVSAVKRVVQELQINGCSDTEISFENPIITNYPTNNPSAPSDRSCHVFDVNGGGLSYLRLNPVFLDNTFSESDHATFGSYHINAHHCVSGIGSDTIPCTPSATDMVISVNFIKRNICIAINRNANLDQINDFSIREGSNHDLPLFNGTYGPSSPLILGDSVTEITGRQYACTQDSDGFSENAYIFHQVLISR